MTKQNEQNPTDKETTIENKANSRPAPPTAAKSKAVGSSSSKGSGTATLALLIAVLGSGTAIGLNFWQKDQNNTVFTEQKSIIENQLITQQQSIKQTLANKEQEEILIKQQITNTQAKITELTNQLTTLQASQQNITSQLTKVNASPNQTWALFEAKQLLKQAFLRLRVTDIHGTISLLTDVNNIIKQQGNLNQSASQINQTIETTLLKLQQVEQVDRSGLYSQLAALQKQTTALQPKQQSVGKQEEKTNNSDETIATSHWQKLSDKLAGYVRVDFNANKQALPLLNAQAVGQIKMALSLAIEKAQWAVLNSEEQIYKAELERITQLIEQYFDTDTTAVTALLNKLNELKTKTVITETPDISETLILVNKYLDQQISLKSHVESTSQGGNN